MGFDKIISRAITKTVKNTYRFELSINDMLNNFKKECPPKEEIIKIIQTKNQIAGALDPIVGTLNSLKLTKYTLNKTLNSLNVIVNVIKQIPIPTAVPPGIGIPVNIITNFADVLDKVGDLIKKGKTTLETIPGTLTIITDSAKTVISKLNLLDRAITICIEKQTKNMSEGEIQQYFEELNFHLTEVGNFSSPTLNKISDEVLLSQLTPNSKNPLYIKGYKLEIQYDVNNKFSFPSRRIRGIDFSNKHTIYNLPDQGYSFSISTQVLVNEIKYRINTYISPTPPQTLGSEEVIEEIGQVGVVEIGEEESAPVEETQNEAIVEVKKNNAITILYPPFHEKGPQNGAKRWFEGVLYIWSEKLYQWEPS